MKRGRNCSTRVNLDNLINRAEDEKLWNTAACVSWLRTVEVTSEGDLVQRAKKHADRGHTAEEIIRLARAMGVTDVPDFTSCIHIA